MEEKIAMTWEKCKISFAPTPSPPKSSWKLGRAWIPEIKELFEPHHSDANRKGSSRRQKDVGTSGSHVVRSLSD